MMFVNAHSALIEDAKVTKGDFVLISAASSSAGLAAIQIANYSGAITIALTRTSAKKRLLLDAGATHVIATEETDLVPEVMRLTGGKGARIALDSKADRLPQGRHVSLGQERGDKMPHAM
jgi:NADPH:quinone reductase-like Zn-dependent oxidoreductase